MRSMLMPSRNHQTENLERLKSPLGEAKGTPLSERIACGQASLFEQPLKGSKSGPLLVGFHGFAQQQITRSMIGDGQRITVAFVAQLELALIVGAPQRIGIQAG